MSKGSLSPLPLARTTSTTRLATWAVAALRDSAASRTRRSRRQMTGSPQRLGRLSHNPVRTEPGRANNAPDGGYLRKAIEQDPDGTWPRARRLVWAGSRRARQAARRRQPARGSYPPG